MQLTRPGQLRQRLVAASCTLLSATAVAAPDPADVLPTPTSADPSDVGVDNFEPVRTVDTALAYYKESGRVTAVEPVVSLRADLGDDESIGMKLTLDTLSGATPNGALPSKGAQTFASPSSHSLAGYVQTYTSASGVLTTATNTIYLVLPGQLPVDPNYHDTRVAFQGDWQLPLNRVTRTTLGGDLSFEHDFLRLGQWRAGARFQRQEHHRLGRGEWRV